MCPNPTDCSHKKRKLGHIHRRREKAMWRHKEKTSIYKQRREGSLRRTNPANSLIPDCKPPELWANRCLLFKQPSQWFSVVADLTNECISVSRHGVGRPCRRWRNRNRPEGWLGSVDGAGIPGKGQELFVWTIWSGYVTSFGLSKWQFHIIQPNISRGAGTRA